MDVHEALCESVDKLAPTVCAWVAIAETCGTDRDLLHEASVALCEANGIGPAPEDVFRWHDSRSRDEVRAGFYKAIAATSPAPYDVLGEVAPLVEEPVA